jgi:hypothetical protein
MRVKKIIIIGLVLLLSGCSTKFIYKNVDWLVYWYLDDFVELTDQQEEVFDLKLATWLEWHKQNEIPKYIAHLDELSTDIASQKISLAKMDYHQQKAAEHWLSLKTRIVPDLVEMAHSLTQEQVTSMFAELDERNQAEAEEREERLDKTVEKRRKETLKRNKKNLKRWIGTLSSEQEKLIENMYGQYHSNGELWWQYRIRYQAELKSLLQTDDRDDAFSLKLTELLMTPEIYRSEELNQRNIENSNTYKSFLLSVDGLAAEEQRLHLLNEISEFNEDLKVLVE